MKSKLFAAAVVAGMSMAGWSQSASAVVIHDESINGDLGTIASPTMLVLGLGDNEIIGEVGNLPLATDFSDAFEIVLGSLNLIAIEVLGIEIDSGSTVRFSNCIAVGASCDFSPNENAGTGLTVADLGGDLLPDLLAAPPMLGFLTNLFELTESEGPSRYRLNFVTANSAIPEPGTLALFGLGLAGLGFARRRKAA